MEVIIRPLDFTERRGRDNSWISMIAAVIILCSLTIPAGDNIQIFPCIIKYTFGIECPGCGMTRAILFLGHGQIITAIKLNPLSPLVYLIMIFILFNAALKVISGKYFVVILSKKEIIILFAMSFIATMSWLWKAFAI